KHGAIRNLHTTHTVPPMEIKDNKRKIPADVICEFTKDGEIFPMRVRIADDDGELHAYTIKEYRIVSGNGSSYVTPDGIYVTNDIIIFECHITVFNRQKTIRLYYWTTKSEWSLLA
ncbi:MAG: hypothetical protein IIZ61_05080, partial [Lachnospiraceae bacterium]|nr:hypothetical protein [Lachnospiraceae bacterium]